MLLHHKINNLAKAPLPPLGFARIEQVRLESPGGGQLLRCSMLVSHTL